MDYVVTKKNIRNTKTVTFNKKVIEENTKRFRFLRKLLNKILSKAPKHLDCYQLKKLFYKNYKNMQDKMQSYVNSSLCSNKSSTQQKANTRKRKRVDSIIKENDTIVEDLLSSYTDYNDSDEEEMSDEELQVLEPKDIRVKQSLQKITKIRALPDYKRIEKLLNVDENLIQRRKRSLNSIVLRKSATPFWNTYSYLLKEIENCVANKYWDKLTTLLIYLSSAVKKCEPLLLKATIINFISNPTSQMHELLEGFLKECYSCRTEADIESLLTQLFHIKPKINTLI